MKKILITLLLLSVLSCSKEVPEVQDNSGVPKELFGIKLGDIFDTSKVDVDNSGSLPIKKFTGSNTFLGTGSHFYFQPLKENKYFPYKEINDKGEKYFETNYRLYLMPIIPNNINSLEQLKKTPIKNKVALIEWSDAKKNASESYYWALEMCNTFKSDIKIEPKIINIYDSKIYVCSFAHDKRELEISNLNEKIYFTLKYDKDTFESMDKEIEDRVRQMKAKEILKND